MMPGGTVRGQSDFPSRQVFEKRVARTRKFLLQARRAGAITTRPRFGAIQVAAVRASVCVLDADQIEILFPVRPLLLQRFRAKANFHPMRRAIGCNASILHVV